MWLCECLLFCTPSLPPCKDLGRGRGSHGCKRRAGRGASCGRGEWFMPHVEGVSRGDSPICIALLTIWGFPGDSDGKESACDAGDLGSVPGLGRSPGGGHGNPLQYTCMENPMDRGAWRARVHGLTKSQMRLSD